jgi:hypothetical protein
MSQNKTSRIFTIKKIGIKILEIENNQKVLGSAPTIK